MATDTFTYTGSIQSWTAPSNLDGPVTIKIWGAGGGDGYDDDYAGGAGGNGGYIEVTYNASSGETLDVYVAGQGENGDYYGGGPGGWGYFNGGKGGNSEGGYAGQGGGGGGACSIVDSGGTLLAESGGGGGASGGSSDYYDSGGGGGGAQGGEMGDSGDTGTSEPGGGRGNSGGKGADMAYSGYPGKDGGDGTTFASSAVTNVTSTKGGGNKGNGQIEFVYSTVSEPDSPYLRSVSASGDDITVDWDATNWNGDQGHYDVYRSQSSGSGFSHIKQVSSGTTQYTDSGLADGEKYYYVVYATNSAGTSGDSNEGAATTLLPAPSNVSASYVADDQIDVSWTDEIDNGEYRIEISRDGAAYTAPSGGSTTVGHNTTSVSYGPNSDNSYDSQVGIDSSFQFRVRSQTSHTSSGWVTTGTVYTSPIPPHNPSVSRPDANTVRINATVKTDLPYSIQVQYRYDDGSGYSGWTIYDNATTGESQVVSGDPSVAGSNVTLEYKAGQQYQYNEAFQSDQRVQFRIRSLASGTGPGSEYVYADYGNEGNVYFEDDFESGDLSAWDSTSITGSTGAVDSTFVDPQATDDDKNSGGRTHPVTGPDEGTYYLFIEDGDTVTKNLGDLSNESDVIVKAAMASSSLDSSSERTEIEWYDGSTWQTLQAAYWEYNLAGWYEVTVSVPSSYLSTDNRLRLYQPGGSGDYGAFDRVVVSDILHEYTQTATPTNLSLDNSVEGELTASWTANASFGGFNVDLNLDGSLVERQYYSNPYTFTGLNDGEQYDSHARAYVWQYRHGTEDFLISTSSSTVSATTRLPAITDLSVSNITGDSADLSWTNPENNATEKRVYLREPYAPTGMQFNNANTEYVDVDPDALPLDSSATILIWTKGSSSQPLRDSIIGAQDGNGNRNLNVHLPWSDENVYWDFGDDPYDRASVDMSGTDWQSWHRWAFTVNPSTPRMAIYMDGMMQTEVSVGKAITSPPGNYFRLGYDSGTYDGIIGSVILYDYELTDTQIQNAANDSPPTDYVGYWPLDLNRGGTTPDLSEYANDGTVNGASLTGPTVSNDSGALAASATSYPFSGLEDGEQYQAYIHTLTEHSETRDT